MGVFSEGNDHSVSATGVSTSQDKIKMVQEWPKPKTGKDLSFLSFASYYIRFVRHFAQVAKPFLNSYLMPIKRMAVKAMNCYRAYGTRRKIIIVCTIYLIGSTTGLRWQSSKQNFRFNVMIRRD